MRTGHGETAPPVRTGRVGIVLFGLTVLGLVPWLAYITAFPIAVDAHAYFLGEYGPAWGTTDAYVYSPAFSQAIEPLRWLGWDGFRTVWRGLELAALAVFAGPFTGPLLFVRPVALEVNVGNIHLLMAAAIVGGFRWPALWAFVLLTKVTPGIGILWFVFRREYRKAAIALGATAAIVCVSFVIAPGDWFAWMRTLAVPSEAPEPFITASLWMRLAAAVALLWWGRERRWTVLAAAFLALPSIGGVAVAMLVGVLPFAALYARDRQDVLLEVRGGESAVVVDDHPLVRRSPVEDVAVPSVLGGGVDVERRTPGGAAVP